MTYRSLFMLDLRSFPSFHGWNKNSRCVSIESPVESIGMKEVEEREGKREKERLERTRGDCAILGLEGTRDDTNHSIRSNSLSLLSRIRIKGRNMVSDVQFECRFMTTKRGKFSPL